MQPETAFQDGVSEPRGCGPTGHARLSVLKTRPRVPSTSRSDREGALRRLRSDVPMVEAAYAGEADAAGGKGGTGSSWGDLQV